MEDQLEAMSRGRDEAVKQLRKIQVSTNTFWIFKRDFFLHFFLIICSRGDSVFLCFPQGQVKELQRELDDSRVAQKEVLNSARESERRSKAMEADIVQLHEVRPVVPSTHQIQMILLLFQH